MKKFFLFSLNALVVGVLAGVLIAFASRYINERMTTNIALICASCASSACLMENWGECRFATRVGLGAVFMLMIYVGMSNAYGLVV